MAKKVAKKAKSTKSAKAAKKKSVTKTAKKPAAKATKTAKKAATVKTAKKAAVKKTAKEAKPAKAVKKKAAPRKRRAKTGKNLRLKAYWGVFNQSLKRVAMFEFNEQKKAEKKAEELSGSGKSPHFVQPVKEVITE
jgi:hypothetical protein